MSRFHYRLSYGALRMYDLYERSASLLQTAGMRAPGLRTAALLLLTLGAVARRQPPPPPPNLCDISDRDSKVHCYCETSQDLNQATKTECWVFNGGIEKSDPFWSSFGSQMNIETLGFNVRTDGGLEFVPTKVLRYLRKLKQFNIKHSAIKKIDSYTFANVTSVEEMTLTKNQIVKLNRHAFYNLPNLTVLTLDENRISELVTETFYELPSLQKLYLTSNNISVIQGGAFRHLVNLVDLELDRNNISDLKKECFDGLANLKRLDLRKNKLTVLNSFTFTELWNLQELLLDYNSIYGLAQRTFDGLSLLRKLSLSNNKLVSLVGGLFEGVRGLASLDLRNNRLQRFTIDNLKPIYDNLKNQNSLLYLEGNDFECDCHLAWMHRLRHEARSVRLRTSLERFVCKATGPPPPNSHYFYERNNIGANLYEVEDKSDLKEFPEEVDEFHDELDEVDTKPRAAGENERTLLQIPVESLPCPQLVKTVTDRTFTHPSQNEVKDYRNMIHTSSAFTVHASFILILVAVVRVVR
ncbi:unnamed protein product [Plutella xylostella]|uniref:(diamondback moth) hypothetical protein n=1 Tax=Plutella xylostella TaxID=51655 RepID=A0A8S4DQI8_PLUXY|nr:unnamed protein product [Plutella xylostella]